MDKKTFLENHPSLKGKMVYTDELYYDSVTKKHREDLDCDLVIPIQDIHKTQIDKQLVLKVIEKEAKHWHNQDWDEIIKKELKLK